jgi:flagellar hook protein FlgE
LEKTGETSFRETTNSGLPQIGTAGSGGRGTLLGGNIEMSNVDLAQEFTNLIIAQRGFQANSRVITTSDQMLQDLVDLKR